MKNSSIYRNTTDRIPVILFLTLTLVDFIVYFLIDNPWILSGYFLLMIVPKGCICAWHHHHQHTMTFKSTWLNRLLEQFYALHTGITTHLWILHHVLGHHHNYLDQTKDESRWKRKNGKKMGTVEYTLNVAATAYYRGYVVGKRYPALYRTHVIFTLITLAMVIALLWYRPVPALLIFVLPMIVSLLITTWATYGHHAGLESDNDLLASWNNTGKVFNLLTGNLGYHTAHHFKQGTHWSKLPALHKTLEKDIPAHLYRTSFWDMVSLDGLKRVIGLAQ